MRVLVTGASGKVGAFVAEEFLARGWAVRTLDRVGLPERLRGRVDAVYADLTDRLALLRAVDGVDAVAHLAAIPHPLDGDEQILTVNVAGTGHLLAACESHGVKRIALASTCCAFGLYFARHPFDPDYLPMDENHPSRPQDLYGLSKLLVEETAAAYTRRCGMTTVALRLTTVMDLEQPHRWMGHTLRHGDDRRYDLWSYVEVRDVARAFRLAIENAAEATHTTAIIAARDSFTALDVRELVARHFPARAHDVENLAPHASLYDTTRAETAFGFAAETPWRAYPALSEWTK